MDHFSKEQNSDCIRAILDNCIKTDSGDPENLLMDFSPFDNKTKDNEMELIETLNQMDIETESVNKSEDGETVSLVRIHLPLNKTLTEP